MIVGHPKASKFWWVVNETQKWTFHTISTFSRLRVRAADVSHVWLEQISALQNSNDQFSNDQRSDRLTLDWSTASQERFRCVCENFEAVSRSLPLLCELFLKLWIFNTAPPLYLTFQTASAAFSWCIHAAQFVVHMKDRILWNQDESTQLC